MNNKQLLEIAKKQIGNGGAKYRKYAGYGGSWCNMFVYWLFNANGCGSLFPMKTAKQKTYCPTSIKWCEKNLAQIPPYLAMACDLIYFDWEKNGVPNHIGIVEHRISTSAIATIEGNTNGGKVAEKDGKNARNAKYVQAIFRPKFAPAKISKCKLDLDGAFEYKSIGMLELALGLPITGILTKQVVATFQKKINATPDCAWGKGTSKSAQTFLKKKGFYKGTIDSDFGKNSVIALQNWINSVNYPQKKPATTEKPSTTTPTTTKKPATTANKAPAGKPYSGKFPTENTNAKIINGLMYRHCWPYGTPQKKYTYKNGKPLKAYTQGINKAYPKHNSWSNKKQKKGACCDVAVGEWLGNVGIHVPKDLKNQLKEMPKNKHLKSNGIYRAKDFRGGMICQRGRKDYSGHTWGVFEDINGKRYIANAHYKKLGGTYAVMDAKPKDIVKSKWKFYKCYNVLGAIRKYYMIGDYGYDVLYIQKFLNWYKVKDAKGNVVKVKEDGDFGKGTETAVKLYQKAKGMTQSGKVGAAMIAKMKAERK